MARRGSTEEIRVWFTATVADQDAPTETEINSSGTDLTPFMRRDGLSTPLSGNTIDNSDAASLYNKTSLGSYGGDPLTLTLYRDDTTDTAWTTLPRTTTGNIIVRRFGGSDVAAANTDQVEVWPIEVISREMADIANDENQRFVVTCAVPGEPSIDAYVGGAS
jgi:hypothetical protein